MSFESPQQEQPFKKEEMLEKITLIVEDLETKQEQARGEVPADIAIFYQKTLDLLDSILREKNTVDRESFIRALEFRRGKEDSEMIDFIIKNSRD